VITPTLQSYCENCGAPWIRHYAVQAAATTNDGTGSVAGRTEADDSHESFGREEPNPSR
jgi:hypothetical protein